MNEATMHQEDFATRCQKIVSTARQLYQSNPDWVTFFREVLGVGGAARSVFKQDEFVAFEKSPEFSEIQQMVSMLRHRKAAGGGVNEPTRVITVRLPESLHEALKAEADDHHTSMNRLCISKLLQVLADPPKGAGMPNRAATPTMPANSMATASQTNFRSSYSPPMGGAMGGNNLSGGSMGGGLNQR